MANKPENIKKKSGQAMILTILALGGTMLGAVTIAGLLMTYQIRQATDLATSAKAIYAADAALERGLYIFFREVQTPPPVFTNGAASETICYDAAGTVIQCTDLALKTMRTRGTVGSVNRAFQLEF